MTDPRICAYEDCAQYFAPKRPHQRFCKEEHRYRQWELDKARAGAEPLSQRVEQDTGNPLQLVREEQAEKKHNRDLGGLIRQAIVDTIKTKGQVHADDLVTLYPAGEVGLCRRLATAQFGSLAASRQGHEPLITEKERRKSSIPERKGAKSGVYVFTKYGRETLIGSCVDTPGGVKVAESPVSSHSVPHVGAASNQNENVGLSAAAQLGGPAESGRSAEPGDLTPVSVPKNSKSDAVKSPPTVATDTGSSDSEVLQLDEAKRPSSSMYDAWEAA